MSYKRILIIGEYLSGKGGTEKVFQDFNSYFSSLGGYQVDFLLLNSNHNETNWLECVRSFSFFDSGAIAKDRRKKNVLLRILLQGGLKNIYKNKLDYNIIENKLLQTRPDIIITNSYLFLNTIKKAIKRNSLSSKSVFWDHMAHSYYMRNDKEFLSNINSADHYFAISTGIENALLALDIPQHKISLIFNPIKQQHESKFSINTIKFIYVGRLIAFEQKRCLDILLATHKIKDLDFVVEFYGDGIDKDILINKSIELEINHKVVFKGWCNYPWEHIKDASCLLLSSEYEGFGLVLAEAISFGIPCISTNCKYGPEDIVTESISGQFYEVGDISALSTLMARFISQPDDFISETKIKSSIEHMYSDNYFLKLEGILQGL